LRTWGDSESGLAEKLADHMVELDERGPGAPTLAFLASGIEGLKVRITAKAETDDDADAILEREVDLLRPVLGDLVFSVDDRSMEQELIDLLRLGSLKVATAESFTGGLVAARLSDVPGSSEVFVGGIVAYESDVKFELLGVPEGPVITEETARAMAEGACRVLGADCAVSTTGVAGPAEQEGHPPGHVCLGWAIDGRSDAITVRLPGDRERVRQFATISVLNLLRQAIVDRAS
jgi:nicotinamide-nucleotide amidase